MKTTPFDAAEYLTTPEAIQYYVAEAMDSNDAKFIAHALGVAARAKSMTDIARKTGLSRESLYKSLSLSGSPEFSTILKVLNALDLKVSVESRLAKPRQSARRKPKLKTAV